MKKLALKGLVCVLVGILFLIPTNFADGDEEDELSLEHQVLTQENPLVKGLFAELFPVEGEKFMGKVPPQWDWRDVDGYDWTTPIKDQLQDVCGSCWAFGSLAALESAIKIWRNEPETDVDLSEQYMLSCSPGSCEGWYWFNTLNWIKNNGAIPESCFPYEADDTIPCDAKCTEWREMLIGIDGYHAVHSDVLSIQNALVEYGPLGTTMDVYDDFYPNYTGGVYSQTSNEYVFGHCITIVGYDDTWGGEGEGYWICKNSWGTEWGEDGWFRIAYGECKIEKSTYYFTGPNYPPSRPEKPEGVMKGKVGEEYTYSATAIDPDDNKIKYCFEWGEGNTTWTSFVNSGETVRVNYTWTTKGDYDIRVKIRDEHGLESDWSDPLPVSMPKTYQNPFTMLLEKIFEWLEQILVRNVFTGIFNP
ncbi:MAG: C1 family peptidase [Candidatus Thermoplasmatota archaeon]|nr:C1 family peptidase [Candidatus Thermoplasmatota archaeon]